MTTRTGPPIAQPATEPQLQTRQDILWREWRNGNDEAFAEHLYPLIVTQVAGWYAGLILAVLLALWGALGGWGVALLLTQGEMDLLSVGVGLLAGGGLGLVAALVLKSRSLTWEQWLQGLLPARPLVAASATLRPNSLLFIVIAGLGSGLGVGITGVLFFGQPNHQFYPLLLGIGLVALAGLALRRQDMVVELVEMPLGVIVGLVMGLFFGLGFAQLVGLVVGPLDVITSGWVVGLATGLAVGWVLGRWGGLFGTGQVVLAMGLMVLWWSYNSVLLAWLVGLLAGNVGGGYSKFWGRPPAKLAFSEAYAYRRLYFWWSRRPPAGQIEAALRPHPLLDRLDQVREQDQPPAQLIKMLPTYNWQERFLARHQLVGLGSEAAPKLVSLTKSKANSLYPEALWLLRSIGYETTARLKPRATQLICPVCLTGCGPHRITWSPAISYYGCRTCGQSRRFYDCPEGVVAVLDEQQMEMTEFQAGRLRVHWPARPDLFDFDRVEIVRATDEMVERFAVAVANDTDPIRQPRYRRTVCAIAPGWSLSPNTLRILARTFGEVRYG